MPEDSQIVTHHEPALRDRSNFIIRIALDGHGLPGRFEQLWARKVDADFELCCIPYFAYRLSLGDRIIWDDDAETAEVRAKAGHRTIRVASRTATTPAANIRDSTGSWLARDA